MPPLTKQSEFAHEAAEIIARCPETVENFMLILKAFTAVISEVAWADMSLVGSHLDEAIEALQEVRAHSEEEISSWVKEHMDSQRRAA